MKRHQCGEDCRTCEQDAEERRYGIAYDDRAADMESEREEKRMDAMWGDV